MLTAVILAAGEAERMGELKQLLDWEEQNTILGKTVDNLLAADIVDEELKIVVGAEKERVVRYLKRNYRTELKKGIIKIVVNDEYQQGMMSSVKKALAQLAAANHYLLFTLADKPFISSEIYREFFQKCVELEAEIFLPEYQGQKGHPVIIKNKFRIIKFVYSLPIVSFHFCFTSLEQFQLDLFQSGSRKTVPLWKCSILI